MNGKLPDDCALLIQSGVLLVSVTINLAYALQSLINLEPGWRYASWYLQLSNIKLHKTASEPAASQRKTTIHKRPANLFLFNLFYCTANFQPVTVLKHTACRESKLTRKKLIGMSVSINCATNLFLQLLEKIGLFQWKTSGDTEKKTQNPPATLI